MRKLFCKLAGRFSQSEQVKQWTELMCCESISKYMFISQHLFDKLHAIHGMHSHSQTVSRNVLQQITALEDSSSFDATLREILRTRVVNTTGHEYVKSFIIK